MGILRYFVPLLRCGQDLTCTIVYQVSTNLNGVLRSGGGAVVRAGKKGRTDKQTNREGIQSQQLLARSRIPR